MMRLSKRTITGILVGAILGWMYYRFVGCSTGACLISSNPYISVPYGALMGYLFVDMIKPAKTKIPKTE